MADGRGRFPFERWTRLDSKRPARRLAAPLGAGDRRRRRGRCPAPACLPGGGPPGCQGEGGDEWARRFPGAEARSPGRRWSGQMAATARPVPRSRLLAGTGPPGCQGGWRRREGGAVPRCCRSAAWPLRCTGSEQRRRYGRCPAHGPRPGDGPPGREGDGRRRRSGAVPRSSLSAAGPLVVRDDGNDGPAGAPLTPAGRAAGRRGAREMGSDEEEGRFPEASGRSSGLSRSGQGAVGPGVAGPRPQRPARPAPGAPFDQHPLLTWVNTRRHDSGRVEARRSTPHGGSRARSRPDQNGVRFHGARNAPDCPPVERGRAEEQGRGARPPRVSGRRRPASGYPE